MPLMPSEANQLNQAQNFIRSHSKGELNFDDNVQPLGYIVSPDGRLVAPVMVAVLHSIQTVLCLSHGVDMRCKTVYLYTQN